MTFAPRSERRSLAVLLFLCALAMPPAAPAQPAGRGEALAGAQDEAYVVREGDTLNGVAARLLHEGESRRVQRALAQHNRLADAERIQPGQIIRIPRAWLKGRPAELEVTAAQGEVVSRGRPLAAGARLAAGDDLRTGKDGYVTLKLADGSTLTLMPAAAAHLERAQISPAGTTDTVVRLDAGRSESAVRRTPKGGSRFEIHTPVAIAAVRGTEFRVATIGTSGASTSEVIGGALAVADSSTRTSVPVQAGFGTRVNAGAPPLAPRPLLSAPALWGGVQLVERVATGVSFTPLRGAQSYRMRVSPREDFLLVRAEEILQAPEMRFAPLSDGDYFVRVRGIDDIGLEGREATARLRVRARAEPPRPAAPPERSRIHGSDVEFAWQAQPGAAGYVLELARDAGFGATAARWTDLREPRHAAANVPPGEYFWRVAAVQQGGGLSLYSEPRALSIRPAPRPLNPARIDDDTIALSWPAEPGRQFDVQIAADAGFTLAVAEKRVAVPEASFARGPQGNYYARVRAVDPDGSVGPYGPVLAVQVPKKEPKPACLVPGSGGVCAIYAPPPQAPR